MKTKTFEKGEKVRVDRSGAGEGYVFMTIKDSVKTDNPNGYDDYNFEENPSLFVCEYYIRKATKKDFELLELYNNLNIADFDIDTDDIKRDFWTSQEPIIKKTYDYLNEFVYPYLKAYNHVVDDIRDINDHNAPYKHGFRTKSRNIVIVKHEHLNIIVESGSTYLTVYITAPYLGKIDKEMGCLAFFNMAVKYSDEQYGFVIALEQIIAHFDDYISKGFYANHFRIDRSNLEYFDSLLLRADYNDWQIEMPQSYTRNLFDISCWKHYFFNKGF